jgi:hypothetical protein
MKSQAKFGLTAVVLALVVAALAAPAGAQGRNSDASPYLYRVRGMMMMNAQAVSFSIAKYLVQGVVKDDQGTPVEGAALHIGKEVVYTDSSGRFMARFSRRGPFSLSVAPEEFITNGVFEVVSAPSEVRAETEDAAKDVEVVVRRVPPPQAKLYKQ